MASSASSRKRGSTFKTFSLFISAHSPADDVIFLPPFGFLCADDGRSFAKMYAWFTNFQSSTSLPSTTTRHLRSSYFPVQSDLCETTFEPVPKSITESLRALNSLLEFRQNNTTLIALIHNRKKTVIKRNHKQQRPFALAFEDIDRAQTKNNSSQHSRRA